MPSVLPPVGDPIPDSSSPMDARTQVRSNIIGADPALDIPGCKWVRASEVTVERGVDDCKVTCGASLQCRFTTSGTKSVISVNGMIKNPTECDVVSVAIDGVSVPFTKYAVSGIWYYSTYNEWLYTGEITFPLCAYVNVAVTTSCGDVCTYKFHSCRACYNGTIVSYPAATLTRSYSWSAPFTIPVSGTATYTVDETLTFPGLVGSYVRNSNCAATSSSSIDVDNAYSLEVTISRSYSGSPFVPLATYEYYKHYEGKVRFEVNTGQISTEPALYLRRRDTIKRDRTITYPGGIGNVSETGVLGCWSGGVFTPGACTAVGPSVLIGTAGELPGLDICGDNRTFDLRIYPLSSPTACRPFAGLIGVAPQPPSWTCQTVSGGTWVITSV